MSDIDLLNYIHADAIMGAKTTETLINTIENTDNKIKDVVIDINKSYNEFLLQSEAYLAFYHKDGKNPNLLTGVSASAGIKFKMLKDNSDAAIAKMLCKGLNMGLIEIDKNISMFKGDTSSEVLMLAREFCEFQSKAIVKLEKFL